MIEKFIIDQKIYWNFAKSPFLRAAHASFRWVAWEFLAVRILNLPARTSELLPTEQGSPLINEFEFGGVFHK